MSNIVQKALEVKKALVSAAAVLITLQATGVGGGTGKQILADILAVLATFGVTYAVKNKPVE